MDVQKTIRNLKLRGYSVKHFASGAEAAERKVAFVRCKGTCDACGTQGSYTGIQDCRAAALSALNLKNCDYGCTGSFRDRRRSPKPTPRKCTSRAPTP